MSDRSEDLTQRLIAHKTGELASLMLHLGLRLGLFEAMRGRAAVSVDALAEASGLHRRWVLVWPHYGPGSRSSHGGLVSSFVIGPRFAPWSAYPSRAGLHPPRDRVQTARTDAAPTPGLDASRRRLADLS